MSAITVKCSPPITAISIHSGRQFHPRQRPFPLSKESLTSHLAISPPDAPAITLEEKRLRSLSPDGGLAPGLRRWQAGVLKSLHKRTQSLSRKANRFTGRRNIAKNFSRSVKNLISNSFLVQNSVRHSKFVRQEVLHFSSTFCINRLLGASLTGPTYSSSLRERGVGTNSGKPKGDGQCGERLGGLGNCATWAETGARGVVTVGGR